VTDLKLQWSGQRSCRSRLNTRVGWTVGTGIEMKFSLNWSGKLEYLYMDIERRATPRFSPTTAGYGLVPDNEA